MIKVFTTGTFDILHYGHIKYLSRAKALGDYLVVGINVNPEGKTPFYSAEERKLMLEAIKYVDEVVLLDCQEDKYQYVKECDIFACGEEYKDYFDIPIIKRYCEVIFLPRTKGISTTKIKEHLREFNTIVVDIDDTISYTTNRDFKNSIPNQPVIDKINELYNKGWKIILFTARGAKSCATLEERIAKYDSITREWLDAHNVLYSDVVFGKPNADYYVDDKNMSLEDFLHFN